MGLFLLAGNVVNDVYDDFKDLMCINKFFKGITLNINRSIKYEVKRGILVQP